MLYESQAIVTSNRVYLLGGSNGPGYLSTVYTAPINSDGTLGIWTTSTNLPGVLRSSQAIVTNNRVYLLGGLTTSVVVSTVYTAPINSDGTLGTWTTSTSLPGTISYGQVIVTNNRVYLLGGINNTATLSTVYTAPINSDGTLGTWTTGTSLPGPLQNSQAIVTNNRVYLLGGVNGTAVSTVYTASIATSQSFTNCLPFTKTGSNFTNGQPWRQQYGLNSLPILTYAGEPYTKVVMNFDGNNGDKIWNDLIATNSWSSYGATISTTQSKFGGSSLYVSSEANRIESQLATGTEFDLFGDFSIECFIYPITIQSGGSSILTSLVSGSSNGWWIQILNSTNQIQFGWNATTYITSTGAATLNSWNYIRLERINGVIKIYINSTTADTTTVTNSTNFTASTTNKRLGLGGRISASTTTMSMYIDALRFSNGVATPFTAVPTAAFTYTAPKIAATLKSGTTMTFPNGFDIGGTNDYVIKTSADITANILDPNATQWIYGDYNPTTGALALLQSYYHPQIGDLRQVWGWDDTGVTDRTYANAYLMQYKNYLYCPGGIVSGTTCTNTVQRLNLTNPAGTWETLAATLPTATYSASACITSDGRLVIAGGVTTGGGWTNAVYSLDLNNPQSSWVTCTVLPQNMGAGILVEYSGYLYMIGGNIPAATAKTYRIALANLNGSWDDAGVTDLPWGNGSTGYILDGSKLYVLGNAASVSTYVIYLDLSNPTGPWVQLPAMPNLTKNTYGIKVNRKAYLIGGYNTSGAINKYCYVLDLDNPFSGYVEIGDFNTGVLGSVILSASAVQLPLYNGKRYVTNDTGAVPDKAYSFMLDSHLYVPDENIVYDNTDTQVWRVPLAKVTTNDTGITSIIPFAYNMYNEVTTPVTAIATTINHNIGIPTAMIDIFQNNVLQVMDAAITDTTVTFTPTAASSVRIVVDAGVI